MASGSFDLTRTSGTQYLLVWLEYSSSKNVVNNTSTVSVSMKARRTNTGYTTYGTGTFSITIDGTETKSTKSYSFTSSTTTILTASKTVSHNNDGSKTITISGSYSGDSPIGGNGSKSFTLDKIDRYPTLNWGENFSDEGNPTLNFSNPSKMYPIRVKIEAGGNSQFITRDISANSTSYKFNLEEAERNRLRALIPNSNTLSVIETVCAMNGNTELNASYKYYTMSIVNANPTIERIDYEDVNSDTVEVTEDNQIIIRNNSLLEFTVKNIKSYKSATLSSVKIIFNGIEKENTSINGQTEANELSFLFGIGEVNVSQNTIASIIVTDSRGNKNTYTKEIQVENWEPPSAIINLQRKNNFYSETYLNVNGNISSIKNKNTMTIEYQYKKTSELIYTELKNIQNNIKETLDLDNNHAWNVRVKITDLFGSATYNLFIDRGIPIVFFDRLKNSVGIDCFPQQENDLALNNYSLSNYYSTDKVQIGIWIDGKPIYRKVNQFTDLSIITGNNDLTVNCDDMETLINHSIKFKYNNRWWAVSDKISAEDMDYSSDGRVLTINATSSLNVQEFIVITEYTEKDTFNFTINSNSYTALKGSTWGEWINSEFNTLGLTIDKYEDYEGYYVIKEYTSSTSCIDEVHGNTAADVEAIQIIKNYNYILSKG